MPHHHRDLLEACHRVHIATLEDIEAGEVRRTREVYDIEHLVSRALDVASFHGGPRAAKAAAELLELNAKRR